MTPNTTLDKDNPLRLFLAKTTRPIPRIKGHRRLVKLLNGALLRTGMPVVVEAKMRLGHRMIIDLRSNTEFLAYYLGDYDTRQIRAMLRLFGADWVVFDVGANVGFYAAPFARKLKKLGGHLHCFEPVPGNFARLNDNLQLNDAADVATVHAIGLSDKPGTAQITLREDFAQGSNTGNAAIVIDDGKDAVFETLPIELSTLDAYCEKEKIARLDFIKVDIEGHEDLFFRGGIEAIKKHRPIILAEMSEGYFERRGVDMDAVMAEIFDDLGYVYLCALSGGCWQRISSMKGRENIEDILLVPEEKANDVLHQLSHS